MKNLQKMTMITALIALMALGCEEEDPFGLPETAECIEVKNNGIWGIAQDIIKKEKNITSEKNISFPDYIQGSTSVSICYAAQREDFYRIEAFVNFRNGEASPWQSQAFELQITGLNHAEAYEVIALSFSDI